MNKTQALKEVDELLLLIDEIKTEYKNTRRFIYLYTKVKTFIADIYGEDSRYFLLFDSIDWNPKGQARANLRNFESVIERKKKEAFIDGLEASSGMLLAIKDDIDKTNDISDLLKQDAINKNNYQDHDINEINPPTEKGTISNSDVVLSFSIVRGTRGYIEKVVHQINGCYKNGWYDGCSVMIRRLIETLIIETFENYKISSKIKNTDGDYYHLKNLINCTLSETSWNLGRDTKKAMKIIKEIGDRSAHSRRFTAHRTDIDEYKDYIRVACQELIYLAELK